MLGCGIAIQNDATRLKYLRPPIKRELGMERVRFERWWALGDDFRTLPINQIVAGIPQFREFALI